MAKIVIEFNNDGTMNVEGHGFEGEGCKDATAFMDELFGEAEKVVLKSSFWMKTRQKDTLGSGFCG